MSDSVDIVKIKFRRGTNSERSLVLFDTGEPGYTTDTKRLFIGDGATTGGIVIGNKYIGSYTAPSLSIPALPGDFLKLGNTLSVYLSGDLSNSASYLALNQTAVDNISIGYNGGNQLYVKSLSSAWASSIDTATGLYVEGSGKLAINYDSSSIVSTGNALTVGTINASQHSNLGGGNLHSLVNSASAGFMSSSDKVKLDASPDWTSSDLGTSFGDKIITTINNDAGSTVTNVLSASSGGKLQYHTNNTTLGSQNGDFYLNSNNAYGSRLLVGETSYTSVGSSKISNIGQLGTHTITLTLGSVGLSNKLFTIIGGDGIIYGFTVPVSTSINTFNTVFSNVSFNAVYDNTLSSIAAAISSVESLDGYGYRCFDTYITSVSTLNVKCLYPGYSEIELGQSTYNPSGIAVATVSSGKRSANLGGRLLCDSVATTFNLPVSGQVATSSISINNTTGATILSAYSNCYITVYDHNYVKNVFYFSALSGGTIIPSYNNNTFYPGTVTKVYPINITNAYTSAQCISAFATALTLAGFVISSVTSPSATFVTGGVGYTLDIYSNYSFVTYSIGGDYLASASTLNGLPSLKRLATVAVDNTTTHSNPSTNPSIQYIRLPGVPIISYAQQAGSRNSVAFIRI